MLKKINAKLAQNFVSANKLCDFNIILLIKERFSGRIPTTQVGKVADILTIHKKYCTQRIAALVEQGYIDVIFSKKNPENAWFKAVSTKELKKRGLIYGKLRISLEPYFIDTPQEVKAGEWKEVDEKIRIGIKDRKAFRSALHCAVHKAVLEKYIKPKKEKKVELDVLPVDLDVPKIPCLIRAKELIEAAKLPIPKKVVDYTIAERKKRASRGYKRIASSTFISHIVKVNNSKGFSPPTVRKHLLRGEELGLVEKTRRLKVLCCSVDYQQEVLNSNNIPYSIVFPENLIRKANAEIQKIFEYAPIPVEWDKDKIRDKARNAVTKSFSYKKALDEINYFVDNTVCRDATGSVPFLYISKSGNIAILQELAPKLSFA